ncbi:MAG: hypothetical protein HQL30_05710 [Candidatus Omnitrophica bacterium]|nr:hypothetical protein [Candidatus Omnitrophota bacterium]
MIINKAARIPETRTFWRVMVLVMALALLSWAVLCVDVLAIMYCRYFSGYDMSFSQRSGNVFEQLYYQNFSLAVKKADLVISAEKAVMKISLVESYREGKFIGYCSLSGVSFEKSGLEGKIPSLDPVVGKIFSRETKYDHVNFMIEEGNASTVIRDFQAVSDDVLLNGDMVHQMRLGDIYVNLDIMLSGKLSKDLLGDFRDYVLSKCGGKDWYKISIAVEGNTKKNWVNVNTDKIDIKIGSE